MTSAILPKISNNPSLSEYIPKNKFAVSPNCPVTEPEFNWLFKQREQNGFALAFVKVSARSFLVHIPSFIECLNAKRGL
ncbi:hypothetical protein AU255_05005 [Methyloprofundus sedimenti]|uniref:Uncharacterized protein n=1 Tax=Methyloprofundus sedimenti TaxID=1420851 RepID=A0A1V8M794_9GAMM|nr:hypothetical protein [Methyloprofundus sedimenti]OQK17253.1 hypothetical protein AU255_05005 [Methyloprofundus sedimenti]